MSRYLMRSIVLLLLLAPNLGVAQTPGTLVEGQRVRVAFRCKLARDQVVECRDSGPPRVVTGHLQGLTSDTLRLRAQSSEAELAIPTSSVAQLWLADGRRRHFWAGAGIGFLAGAVIGGVIGSTQDFCFPFEFSCSPATLLGVITYAPLGFLLGGVVGASVQSDRWRPLPVNCLGMSVEPRLNAIGLTVAVVF